MSESSIIPIKHSAADKLQAWPSGNNTRCCACWFELAINDRSRFLCASCLYLLPDAVRRNLQNSPRENALGAMNAALVALCLDPKSRMITLPRAKLSASPKRHCACASPRSVGQADLLTGGEDNVCGTCGLGIR